jgi:putative membrane protein
MNRIKGLPAARPEKLTTITMALLFLVGIAGHIVDPVRPIMLAMSPYFLTVLGLFALYPEVRHGSLVSYLWMSMTFLITFGLESVGTATGAIFGPYTYGPTLGFSLLNVPVVIAFNWLIVILGALAVAGRILSKPVFSALAAGCFALLFDLVLEPVAIALDYWNWHSVTIPLRNYAAWFAVSFAAAYIYNRLGLKTPGVRLKNYVLIQFAFFAVLRIVLEIYEL